MKKIVICIVLIGVLTSLVGCGSSDFGQYSNSMQESTLDLDITSMGQDAKSYLVELSEQFPNRTSGGEQDYVVAQWLSELMIGWGYGWADSYDQDPTKGLKEFQFSSQDSKLTGYNAVFSKKSQNDNSKGTIVLACYYDNSYAKTFGNTILESDGTYESGASIGAVLVLAKYLSDKSLDYDIEIAFLGGGAFQYAGANAYINNLKAEQLNNIRLFINFGQLIGGDNLYAFSRDRTTDYNEYIYKVANINNLGLTKIPLDKKTIMLSPSESSPYAYFHIGMMGNNLPIMDKGIPSINLLSTNWSSSINNEIIEIKDKPNVMGTKDDTLDNLISRVGEEIVIQRLGNVSALVATMLTEPSYASVFDQALSVAKNQEINFDLMTFNFGRVLGITINIILAGVIIAIAMSIRSNIQKNKSSYTIVNPLENLVQQQEEINVFGQEFDQNQDNNNDDDVFEGF